MHKTEVFKYSIEIQIFYIFMWDIFRFNNLSTEYPPPSLPQRNMGFTGCPENRFLFNVYDNKWEWFFLNLGLKNDILTILNNLK